jgi:hypothetical protein
MIVILYPPDHQDAAGAVGRDLTDAFAKHVEVALIRADSGVAWPGDASWDDLLILMYDAKAFPDSGKRFATEYRRQRSNGSILPVALDPTSRQPPEPAEGIKALEFDTAAQGVNGRLANRVGGMLGLRVQGRETKIFVSYRATDGATVARQVHDHLLSLGHSAWLDEAKEIDGETKILPGTEVQGQIDEALDRANLLLLIDTPSAPTSRWIKHEIDTADALLLPILPVSFRDVDDQTKGPRFRSLLALQRWVEIEKPDLAASSPLRADQLDQIVSSAERYLCEIFKRKCRVPFIVETQFVSGGFVWRVLDKRLLMFESSKSQNPRLLTRVLSHCSVFDRIYSPALKRFNKFLRANEKSNYSLFIYDGELLPESDLQEITAAQEDPVIILHHQELSALINSNFTTLVAA